MRFSRQGFQITFASILGFMLACIMTVASGATTGPSITVMPSAGLHNGTKVTLAGKKFPKNTALVIVECNPNVLKGQSAACDSAGTVSVKTGSNGTFSKTSFKVITGTVGNGKCGTTAKNLTCYIFVSEPSLSSTVAVDEAIKFAKP